MTLPRYLDPTHIALDAIIARAKSLDAVLADVHSLAYDKPINRDAPIGGGADGSEYDTLGLDAQGKQKAKRALADLERFVLKVSKDIENHYATIYSLFQGPSANEKLRGTTLGNDKGHGAQIELNRLKAKQNQRKERGEYTPHADEEQPEIPQR